MAGLGQGRPGWAGAQREETEEEEKLNPHDDGCVCATH